MAGTHSKLSPSSAERWWNCPYSLIMETKFKRETKRDAAEGTVMHEIAAKVLSDWWANQTGTGARLAPASAGSWVGEVIEADGFKITVTESMTDAIDVYTQHVQEITDMDGRTGTLLIEHNIEMTLRGEACGGTIDAIYMSGTLKKIFICDLKGGRGKPVSVERNRQMLQYACAVTGALMAPYDQWELAIIQPRYNHADGRIRRKLYAFSDIVGYRKELAERIEYIKANPNEIKCGSWCTWCAGHGQCDVEAKQNMMSAASDFTAIDSTPSHTLSPDQIAKFLSIESNVMSFYEGLHSVAQKLIEAGVEIPGFKAVTKYGHRRWIDDEKVSAELSMLLGDKIYDRKLKSPAGIEKLLGKGKAGKEAFASLCSGNVEVPIAGVDIVPVSDNRPAIKSSAQLDFQDPATPNIDQISFSKLGL